MIPEGGGPNLHPGQKKPLLFEILLFLEIWRKAAKFTKKESVGQVLIILNSG